MPMSDSEAKEAPRRPMTGLEKFNTTRDGFDAWKTPVLEQQRIYLRKMQLAAPGRPIRLQHKQNDEWHFLEECFSKGHAHPYETIGILANEVVFDIDFSNWEDVADSALNIIAFLLETNAPFQMFYSGGKGIHIHLLLFPGWDFLAKPFPVGPGDIDKPAKTLLQELKDREVDIDKVIRETVFKAIAKAANVEIRPHEGLDARKVSWGIRTKGSAIRMCGCPRSDGRFKTYITEVPKKKPEPGPMPAFPDDPPIPWDYSRYYGICEEALRATLERYAAAAANPPVKYDGDLEKLPCRIALMTNPEEGMGNDGCRTIAMQDLEAGLDEGTANADVNRFLSAYAIKNPKKPVIEGYGEKRVRTAYSKGSLPSCVWIEENLGGICNRLDCPKQQKKKEAKAAAQKEPKASPKGSIDERLKKEAEMKKLQNQAEPFIYPDGRTGFYIPDYGIDCIHSLDEWAEVFDKGMNDALLVLARGRDELHWYLPSVPDPSKEDKALLDDLVAYIKGFVEFPQERLYYCFAVWLMATYLTEKLCHAPRWIVSAPTEHGKGRALKMAKLLGYRAVLVGDPTVAVLYRLSGWYRATVLIDEIQDLQADQKEVYGRVMGIFKLGFDVGAVIPRMNNDNSAIDGFKAYSFMMVAAKRFSFKEDEQNRAIMVTMRKRTRELRADPMGDPQALEEATALRTRLHAFRIRALHGVEDIDSWKATANGLIAKNVLLKDPNSKVDEEDKGEEIILEDRSKEKATSLLLACAKFGHSADILQVIAEAQKKAKMEQSSTVAAQVFSSLQTILYGVIKGKQCELDSTIASIKPQELRGKLDTNRIYLASIRDQLIRDLVNGNASEDGEQIPDVNLANKHDDYWKEGLKSAARKYDALEARYTVKTVGNVLRRDLGFEAEAGAKNKSYLTAKRFKEAYASALLSFGSRFGIEDPES